jgi:hypothetical protein
MSLLLFWENPLDTYNPRSSRVEIFRQDPAGGLQLVVTDDATWGFYEDSENSNPEATYQITYKQARDLGAQLTIPDVEISRHVRLPDQALFTFEKRLFTGAPDAGRGIELSDYSNSANANLFRLLTNQQGIAKFILKYGTRVLIQVDDEYKALDAIVPAKKDVSWPDLIANGSWVTASRRGIF